MGMVKRDVNKKMVQYESTYPYIDIGIENLLKDIYRIYEDQSYRGDISAAILRMDLERALQSNCLTPRQRQCVALYYFCQLTYREIGDLLGIAFRVANKRVEEAIVNIAKQMDGEIVKVSQLQLVEIPTHDAIGAWLENAAYNEREWWSVPESVWQAIRDRFGMEPPVEDLPADNVHPFYIGGHKAKNAWRREVLMADPDTKSTPITRSQRKSNEMYGADAESTETKRFYVRNPNDGAIKKYGDFWTYHEESPVTKSKLPS